MLGCLFHGSTSAAVLEAMPSLRVHQQTLQRALAFDYDWRAHDIFVTHNNPSTEKPKVTLKEVSRLHTRTQPHMAHSNTHHAHNTPQTKFDLVGED
jgi:hypothetical protein